ncbi:uncharacterized protein DMENIID0001_015040 [Sergentomyia squamirostris]
MDIIDIIFLCDLSDYVKTRHSNPNLIKSIALIECSISDTSDQVLRSLGWIESATGFEVVSLSMNSEVTGKSFKLFKDLKEINLYGCENLQTNYFINFCQNNQTLIRLNINECYGYNGNRPFLDQECINCIAENLQNLEVLAFDCPNISNGTKLSALADLPKLKSLYLEDCNLLAVPLLDRLAKHNRLEVFDWSLNDDDEKNIACLFLATLKFQGLKEYALADFSGKTTFVIDELLYQATMNNLVELIIPETTVTDEGIYQFILKNPSP